MMRLHVSTAGNDAWSGESAHADAAGRDGPFATLARARDAIRSLKAASGLPPGGVEVVVGGGEYALAAPLAFTREDSGTAAAPVLYRAAAGETARLSGGVKIADWRPVDDAPTLARLHPEARGHVMRADLAAHGVTDLGGPLQGAGSRTSDPGLELFFGGRPMTVARYPNDGYLHIAALSEDDGHHIREARGSRVGRFQTRDVPADRLQRWAAEPGATLHGYWFWDWSDQRIAVKHIEPDTGEITLDDTHPHTYGYRVGQWFYAFNLLCELSRAGEWVLDRETGTLYFWPPVADPAAAGTAVVSVLRDPVTFDEASHLTLQGFTLQDVRGTAIRITGGTAVRIAGCVLRNIGKDAVRVDGGRRHAVVDCDIEQTGDGGICLDGGDRQTLTPGEHEALNNHIHHIARWNPLYKVGIQLKGCGNRAAQNRIHHIPHIAIGFTGNDQVVEYNEIYQAVTGANDAGAIYTSGAHPEDWSMRGHRIRYNYLHHLFGFRGEGCSGIYLDDMFSGTEIHGNILYRVALGFLLGGGRDIVATNNVFVDCPRAISLDARATGWAAFSMPAVIAGLESMPYCEEPWASRYPELVRILDDEPAVPKGNVIARNIFCRGGGYRIEEAAQPGLQMEGNLEGEDPCFVDEARQDFRLRDDSPAMARGFEPVPLARIGLQPSPLRVELPARRLFEAEVVVAEVPRLRAGRCVQPGVVRLQVRNVGEVAESGVFRIRASGGRLEDESLHCSLAPYDTAERRYALWPESDGKCGAIHLAAVQDGVDGVLDARVLEPLDEAMTPWPAALSVSAPVPGGACGEGAEQAPSADELEWRIRPVEPDAHFCNVNDAFAALGNRDGAICFGCRIRCAEPMRVALLVGYDGPIRIFLNGVPFFHDPTGATPARPDEAAPEVDLEAGAHELIAALGADQGRAWGIFLRLRRLDPGAGSEAPVLPEILPL